LKYLQTKWITAEGNEWLVVVKNGEYVTSGIGLKVF
jgi:hypothetical protein